MIPLKMDKKNILEYYFGSKSKYALVVTMAISKKQRKKPQQQQKTPQVRKELAMYDYFYDHKPLAATNLLSISDLIEGNRCQRDQKYTRPPFSY